MRRLLLLLPLMMIAACLKAQRADNYKPTNNAYVRLTKTNMPIVFINVNGRMIQREDRITARMKIIDNGEGQYNYGDTLAYPNQKVDYEGYVALKYRGNSSFNNSDKKPYSFRPLDKPLEEGGEKQKVKIMGMGKDNDWALLAPFSDKSMIRDVLTFELGRPYFDFVPHAKFCEVVLDGTYYGVFIMSERVGKGKKRLNLNDPGEDDGDLTGDYLVEIDRDDEPEYYQSKYHPVDGNGNDITSNKITYQYSAPDYEDFAELPPGTREALHKQIDDMEASFRTDYYTDPERGYRKYIDETSFIDYMLSTEFSFNIDGYRLSTNLYKYSETRAAREGLDPRWKMSLWDFNIAYGNANYSQGERTDLWQYDFNARNSDAQLVPFWWYKLTCDKSFINNVKLRWQQYRNGQYSDEAIEMKIDSLTNVITSGGALGRNQSAWNIIGRSVWPNYYVGQTYGDEIEYLKNWIRNRVIFMDKKLLPRDPSIHYVPVDVVRGWNGDVVIEALPASSSTTGAIDGNRSFYSEAVIKEGGLPDDRVVVSNSDIEYHLSPYDGSNALYLTYSGQGGEIVFDKPFATSELCMLATSGKGQSEIEVVVNYTDGASSSPLKLTVRDWSVRNPVGDEAVTQLGCMTVSNSEPGTDCHYCLFEQSISCDADKQVKSVTITQRNDATLSVLAFSRMEKTPTAISGPSVTGSRTVTGIYSADGVKLSQPKSGLNIMRYSDGTARKVIVR